MMNLLMKKIKINISNNNKITGLMLNGMYEYVAKVFIITNNYMRVIIK